MQRRELLPLGCMRERVEVESCGINPKKTRLEAVSASRDCML